jgi:hypothetical protein
MRIAIPALMYVMWTSTMMAYQMPKKIRLRLLPLLRWDPIRPYQHSHLRLLSYTPPPSTVTVTGSSPSRTLTFEYYASYYNHSSQYYHFQVLFYENRTDSFTFKYYNITDKSVNAVVGYQCQHSEFGRSFDGLE